MGKIMEEIDESAYFCYDCAKKKVEELTKKLGEKIEILHSKIKVFEVLKVNYGKNDCR